MPRAEKYYPNASQLLPKKKHVCSTCERAFTTSGHLARHIRVHTGERNHKCPFPGCETRCSRQDNLQQHYRIHMSPGSRRNSARSAAIQKRAAAAAAASSSSSSSSTTATVAAPPSPPGRGSTQTPPPGSPPPLTHATLPATASMIVAPAGRLSSSPDRHLVPPHTLTLTASTPLNYNYRTLVHPCNTYSYTPSSFHGGLTSRNPSMATSRLSISHISNPHYPPSQPASTSPPSPASVSSQASPPSAPPTPSYQQVSYDDNHSYSNQLAHGHIHTQPHMTIQTSYPSPRFNNSPPPTLAPIQDVRFIRRQEPRHFQQSHSSLPYIHHPQPLSDYSYHHSIALGHGAWKTDSIRKGVGPAAVI